MIRHRRWQDGVLVVDQVLPAGEITPELVAAAQAEERRRREVVGGCCGGAREEAVGWQGRKHQADGERNRDALSSAPAGREHPGCNSGAETR